MEIKVDKVKLGLDKLEKPGKIRKAKTEDISRIAEIVVLAKRMFWRHIYHHDEWIFQDLQVLPLCREYEENPESLEEIYVYDDPFVKGMIRVSEGEVQEIFVDPFFQMQGIGNTLLDFGKDQLEIHELWVKEKNEIAIRFFEHHGFQKTSETRLEEKTEEPMVKMVR